MNKNEEKLLHIQSKGGCQVTLVIMPRGDSWASLQGLLGFPVAIHWEWDITPFVVGSGTGYFPSPNPKVEPLLKDWDGD